MTTYGEPQVEHNQAHHRYEIIIDDQRSMIQYQMRGDTIIFVHTEVPPALEGRGIAGRMARKYYSADPSSPTSGLIGS